MNFYGEDKSPERHSIHGNSPSPIRHRGNMDIHMPNGAVSSSSGKKSNKDGNGNVPFIGNNIDGIPLSNSRSPQRNQGLNGSNSSGSKNNDSSPNLNFENQNPSYVNQQ
jgi:hypothetical protein